ncbi:hypothetical protein ANCDUO_04044 [Ancylostoma duodenale]|uniref:Uncharacterized protein n=1 Tax=Ancylostoma duodenale TaxID=51022 RepID=A0A0C2DS78_9BILA|nr:hypothetical protein ANCDUO_04044 [Ancylostoma duodenale]
MGCLRQPPHEQATGLSPPEANTGAKTESERARGYVMWVVLQRVNDKIMQAGVQHLSRTGPNLQHGLILRIRPWKKSRSKAESFYLTLLVGQALLQATTICLSRFSIIWKESSS